MTKTRVTSLLLFFWLFITPAVSQGFDCFKPPFGASLEELNKNGQFVKYKENDGLAYYNYTGACDLGLLGRVNPVISWAFVQDQLYARIMMVAKDDRADFERLINARYGPPNRITKDGDWTVFIRESKDKTITHKIKYNNKTKEIKGSMYYEPLRAKLNDSEQPLDPANLVE